MKKPKKKPWKPKTIAAQIKSHKATLAAAYKKAHRSAAQKAKAAEEAKKAAATRAKTKRKWSPDEDVALCSARAVAESVRLALGTRLSDADVLALYWRTAPDADAGASIWETLNAAQTLPQRVFCGLDVACAQFLAGYRADFPGGYEVPAGREDVRQSAGRAGPGVLAHPIILGLELPDGNTHAVVAHDGVWWSWGEPHPPGDFPGAVIEEAWAVTWS